MRTRRAVAALGALTVCLTGCNAAQTPAADPVSPATATATTNAVPGGDGLFARIPEVVRQVEPSVVTIFTEKGLGSGVVYREDGIILTNEHVIEGNRKVQVAFADGKRADGTVVAADTRSDLAVVRVERDNLRPAAFQTKLPEPGELVMAMGSPLGFENTVTAGIVSGLDRNVPGSARAGRPLVGLIQTDAAISPGVSGGALVNIRGEVVGITEAYIPPQAGAVAIGFAIPAGTATGVAEELLTSGKATHAYLGVGLRTLTPEIARTLQVGVESGVVVTNVADGSPADDAGLRPGDVITAVEGREVSGVEEVLDVLRGLSPGDTATLRIWRDGSGRDIDVVVAESPSR